VQYDIPPGIGSLPCARGTWTSHSLIVVFVEKLLTPQPDHGGLTQPVSDTGDCIFGSAVPDLIKAEDSRLRTIFARSLVDLSVALGLHGRRGRTINGRRVESLISYDSPPQSRMRRSTPK
jgi:hypothetical protein